VAEAGERFRGATIAHSFRTKEEVDRLMQVAAQAGAVVIMHAQDVDWGGCSGYFAAPDGHL